MSGGWAMPFQKEPSSAPAGASWDTRRRTFRQLPPPTPEAPPAQDVAEVEVCTERAFSVGFGGAKSRQCACAVRIEPADYNHTIRVHLVAQAGTRWLAAPDIMAWDPATEVLTWTSYEEFETLAGRLDMGIGASNFALKTIGIAFQAANAAMENFSSANFILVGGVIPILIALYLYYFLMWMLLKFVVLGVLLPGCVLGIGISLLRGRRLARLENEWLANARALLAEFQPASPWSPRRTAD